MEAIATPLEAVDRWTVHIEGGCGPSEWSYFQVIPGGATVDEMRLYWQRYVVNVRKIASVVCADRTFLDALPAADAFLKADALLVRLPHLSPIPGSRVHIGWHEPTGLKVSSTKQLGMRYDRITKTFSLAPEVTSTCKFVTDEATTEVNSATRAVLMLSYAELKELSSSMLRAWGQNPKNDTRPDGFTQGVYRSVVMMREICAKKRAARRPTKVVKTECANGGDNGLDGQVSDLSDSSASKRKITELETQISEVCSQHKVEMRSTKKGARDFAESIMLAVTTVTDRKKVWALSGKEWPKTGSKTGSKTPEATDWASLVAMILDVEGGKGGRCASVH